MQIGDVIKKYRKNFPAASISNLYNYDGSIKELVLY